MEPQENVKGLQRIEWGEVIIPLLSILFSLVYLSQVWGEPRIVVLWPYLIMALLLFCSALIVMGGLKKGGWRQEVRKERDSPGIFSGMKKAGKPLLICGITVIYLAFMGYLGFSLSNFLYLTILIRCLGTRKAWTVIGLSLLITAILHLVMVEFLQMPVPRLIVPWTEWQI